MPRLVSPATALAVASSINLANAGRFARVRRRARAFELGSSAVEAATYSATAWAGAILFSAMAPAS